MGNRNAAQRGNVTSESVCLWLATEVGSKLKKDVHVPNWPRPQHADNTSPSRAALVHLALAQGGRRAGHTVTVLPGQTTVA